jgi:hypothetical protein
MKQPKALECPVNLVPADVRQTGMRGTLHGTREEAYAEQTVELHKAGWQVIRDRVERI